MKGLILFAALLPFSLHAQQYTRAEIKHAADSIMHTFLRADMFAACESDLDNDHYLLYAYKTTTGKIKTTEVPRQPMMYTKGKFQEITIPYNMKYIYRKCASPELFEGPLYVTLDRYLDMKKAPDIGSIPDYVWENDSCRSWSNVR